MRNFTLTLAILGFFSFSAPIKAQTAQTFTVAGTISSSLKAVESASVSLVKAKDSSVVKAGVTGKDGQFEISTPKEGKYLVMVQSLGYSKYYSETFELSAARSEYTISPVSLKQLTKELAAVTVTSAKPFIEQKIDRVVLNVDASPTNGGLNVLDILEKAPGVTVDKDGNVSLKGKTGVMILLDGRPTYLSGQDLANMLKNIPGNNLDQIEIMTQPSAKYDASGNSGMINIKTKKNRAFGYNGSVTLGAGQGFYAKTSNSVNMNYREGKFNFFGNYSYSTYKDNRSLDLVRNFRDQSTNSLLSIFSQQTNMINSGTTNNYKFGADFFASKKTIIGFVINGMTNPRENNNGNITNIEDNTGVLQTQTLSSNKMNNQFDNFGLNLNFKQTLDTTGKEITADMDYIHYNSQGNQVLGDYFYNNTGVKIQPDEILQGNLPSIVNIYSAKIDYVQPIKGGAKFEAGLKSSYVKTDNNAQYSNLTSGVWVPDASRSNHFLYNENINAAYVNFSKQLSKKWSAQLGLRLENTISLGNQLTTNTQFNRDYTQLFPTAFIGFTPNDKNQFSLSYGRRINRPDYEDMNPFFYFLDKYTYQVGNPYLQPQISHNIELNNTFHGFLTTGISYSRVDDIILDVISQVDSTHTSFVKKQNVAQMSGVTISTSLFTPVTKFWKINVYAQLADNKFSGIVNGGYLSVDGLAFSANMSNQFQFKKGWNFELSGFYRGSAVMGTLVSNPLGQVSFAVSKQVLKNKGTVRVNFRDFLNLQHFSGYSRYQNIDLTLTNRFDNRFVNLSFTYRFSKGKAAPAQQRKRGGADDEANRVKGGN